MSIGLYIVLAPLYLKSVRKLQEKRFVFVKILAIIIPENGAKVSKIKCFQFAQQTLNKTSSNMLFGNTGEITYSSHGDVSRGMAEIDITLPENYKLNKRNLTDHLCQSCLDKVAASLEYWKYEDEKKEPIPLCLVDFKTLDIYSLQDYYRSVFIRDYYVEMGFEEISVEVKTFYLPKR